MYEELKARLREHDDERLYLEADELLSQAAYAIEQLERQLEEARGNYLGAMTDCGNLERQIAEYLDAPVVAWGNLKDDGTPCLLSISQHPEDRANWMNPKPLIVKPGE